MRLMSYPHVDVTMDHGASTEVGECWNFFYVGIWESVALDVLEVSQTLYLTDLIPRWKCNNRGTRDNHVYV